MVDEKQYRAFLIRLHRGQAEPHWRVTLHNTHSDEVLRFATERDFVRYLLTTLKKPSQPLKL